MNKSVFFFFIELDPRSAFLNTSSRLSEALREVGARFWDEMLGSEGRERPFHH